MGDKVQSRLEGFIPPLRDLEDRGVFSTEEVRDILHRRRECEYELMKATTSVQHYLRYIHAETDLEHLRRERMPPKQNQPPKPADSHIVQLIHNLFHRVTRRYPSDHQLFFQHYDFCVNSKSFKRIKDVLATALRKHPHVPHFWVLSASRAFEDDNLTGARIILLKGLRLHETHQGLWEQFLKLEGILFLQAFKQSLTSSQKPTCQAMGVVLKQGATQCGQPFLEFASHCLIHLEEELLALEPDKPLEDQTANGFVALRNQYLDLLMRAQLGRQGAATYLALKGVSLPQLLEVPDQLPGFLSLISPREAEEPNLYVQEFVDSREWRHILRQNRETIQKLFEAAGRFDDLLGFFRHINPEDWVASATALNVGTLGGSSALVLAPHWSAAQVQEWLNLQEGLELEVALGVAQAHPACIPQLLPKVEAYEFLAGLVPFNLSVRPYLSAVRMSQRRLLQQLELIQQISRCEDGFEKGQDPQPIYDLYDQLLDLKPKNPEVYLDYLEFARLNDRQDLAKLRFKVEQCKNEAQRA